jgi:hypothetical protein
MNDIISYMNYKTLNKIDSLRGKSLLRRGLWQSIVILGLIMMGSLHALGF